MVEDQNCEAAASVVPPVMSRRALLKASSSVPLFVALGGLPGVASAATTTMRLPSNFNWIPLVNVLKTAPGQYTVDKTAADLKPGGVTKTYYVDPTTGNNANPGTSGSPLASLYVALAKNDAAVATLDIKVRPPATRILWGTKGCSPTTAPTKNIVISAVDGGEIILAKTLSSKPPVWAALGNGCYTTKCGVGSNNTSLPTDWNPSQRALTPDGLGRAFQKAASAAAVQGHPGTYFHDIETGLVTLCPFDGRSLVGDGYIIPTCQMGANGAFNIRTVSLTMWLSKCIFVGGSPFYGVNSLNGVRGTVVMDQCAFYASSNAAGTNGIGLTGAYDAYLFDCTEGLSWADAFGFHGNGSGSTRAMLIRPKHRQYNGRSGSGADNVFTSHESGRLVVVMPDMPIGSCGRTAGTVDTAWMIVFGGRLAKSLLTNNQSSTIHTGGTAKFDVYEVTVESSKGPYTYAADAPSIIYTHGMSSSGQTKSGRVQDMAT